MAGTLATAGSPASANVRQSFLRFIRSVSLERAACRSDAHSLSSSLHGAAMLDAAELRGTYIGPSNERAAKIRRVREPRNRGNLFDVIAQTSSNAACRNSVRRSTVDDAPL